MNTIKNAFALVKNNWQYMPRWAKVADAIHTLIPVLLLVLWIVGWTEAILAIAGL